jgi:hypothetical protein
MSTLLFRQENLFLKRIVFLERLNFNQLRTSNGLSATSAKAVARAVTRSSLHFVPSYVPMADS